MEKYYTAVNTRRLEYIRNESDLIPEENPAGEGFVFHFTEDSDYWKRRISEQADLEDVHEYRYAVLVEFKLKGGVIQDLMTDSRYGRFSRKVYEYHQKIGKEPGVAQDLNPADSDVLVLSDIYESGTTQARDGISQLYSIRCGDPTASNVWEALRVAVVGIAVPGGIPGAT